MEGGRENKTSRDTCVPSHICTGNGLKHLHKKREGNVFVFAKYDERVTSVLKAIQLSSRIALSKTIFFEYGNVLYLHCPIVTASHVWLS